MASSIIPMPFGVVQKKDTITVSLSHGYNMIEIGNTWSPTGMTVIGTICSYGSTTGLRNGVVFVGLSINRTRAIFYSTSNSTESGSVEIKQIAVPNDYIVDA